eukprot:7377183-Prymnesium_polylepis.1
MACIERFPAPGQGEEPCTRRAPPSPLGEMLAIGRDAPCPPLLRLLLASVDTARKLYSLYSHVHCPFHQTHIRRADRSDGLVQA